MLYQMQAVMKDGSIKPLEVGHSNIEIESRQKLLDRLNAMIGKTTPEPGLSTLFFPILQQQQQQPPQTNPAIKNLLLEVLATRTEEEQASVMALYYTKPAVVEKVVNDLQSNTSLLVSTLLKMAQEK
jgi:hypothetical protein